MKKRFQRVSIITPSFNQAKYIERTIKSVLAQDYPNIEHIIVDGGSTDGTVKILKKYKHLRWVSEKDKGQSHAVNKGIAMAKGEIIGWLNSDDMYYPDAVRTAVKALQENPKAVMVYSDCDLINEKDGVIGRQAAANYGEFLHIAWYNAIPQQSAFMLHSAVLKAGKIDETLCYVMDFEYWVRLGRVGRLHRLPCCLAMYRIVAGTKTMQSPEKSQQELLSVCKKYHVTPMLRILKYNANQLLTKLGFWKLYIGVTPISCHTVNSLLD